MKDILTTGQAAKLCRVAPRTISKWADAGLIPGVYRLPGCDDRRFPARQLLAFMLAKGMLVPPELSGLAAPSALLCGFAEADADRVELAFSRIGWATSRANNWAQVIACMHQRTPTVLAATAAMGRSDCWDWAASLKLEAPGVRLVYVPGDDEVEHHLFHARGWETLAPPVTAERLGLVGQEQGRA